MTVVRPADDGGLGVGARAAEVTVGSISERESRHGGDVILGHVSHDGDGHGLTVIVWLLPRVGLALS